jgi:hypothetical protein
VTVKHLPTTKRQACRGASHDSIPFGDNEPGNVATPAAPSAKHWHPHTAVQSTRPIPAASPRAVSPGFARRSGTAGGSRITGNASVATKQVVMDAFSQLTAKIRPIVCS